MKLKLNISKLILLKEKLKKFRKFSAFNGRKKRKLCKEFNLTHDEIDMAIQQIAYDNIKQKEIT